MSWRKRAKVPVAASKQQNQLVLSIDPATLHVLGKFAIELVKLIAPKNTVVPVSTPKQTIVPNGVLNNRFGTVFVDNNTSQNVVWTNKNGVVSRDGWVKELFVINNRVYAANANTSFVKFADTHGAWEMINSELYADLRAVATTIITSSATYNPDPIVIAA